VSYSLRKNLKKGNLTLKLMTLAQACEEKLAKGCPDSEKFTVASLLDHMDW
jgi:hypothetical protein